MKNTRSILYLLFVMAGLLVSCSTKEEIAPDKKLFPLCFELKKDFELLKFPDTRSIPGYRPSDPRATDDSGLLFNTIEYLVFDNESGAVVKHERLTADNADDFGEYLYDELEAGEYLIALMAHSSSAMVVNGRHAAGTDVTDTFYAKTEINVGPDSETSSIEITLKRLVSRVEFAANKHIPDSAARLILEIQEQYNTLDIKAGSAGEPRSLRKEFALAGGTPSGDSPVYSFYTFVPEPARGDTSYLGSVKLITLDIDNDTLHSVRLTAVPVMKNRITRYTGSLFAPNTNKTTLEIDVENFGQWKDTIQVPI